MQWDVLLRVPPKNNEVGIATRVVECQDIANLPKRDIMELHTGVIELQYYLRKKILFKRLFFLVDLKL